MAAVYLSGVLLNLLASLLTLQLSFLFLAFPRLARLVIFLLPAISLSLFSLAFKDPGASLNVVIQWRAFQHTHAHKCIRAHMHAQRKQR